MTLGVAACGGDDPDPVDCVGHGCPGIDSPFQLPEGGEFRLEVIDSADGPFVAGQAFFFKAQTPEFRALGPDALFVSRGDVECFDYRAHNLFDNGATPEAQQILDTREYYDVGDSVALTSRGGGEFVMPKSTDNIDDSAGLMHDVLYENNDATLVENNTAYTPSVQGSADFPGLDLSDGEAITGEDWTNLDKELFMPPTWEFTGGDVIDTADYFDGVELVRGADASLQWTNDESPDSEQPQNMAFLGVFNDAGAIDFYCFVPDADEGELIIPSELVDEMEDTGTLLIGKFTHIAWENRLDGTRLDLLGIECKAAPYTKVDL